LQSDVKKGSTYFLADLQSASSENAASRFWRQILDDGSFRLLALTFGEKAIILALTFG